MGALSTAVSGMNAMQQRMSVISNNIANSETTGFKSSTLNFQEEYVTSTGQYANGVMEQVGNGVRTAGMTQNWISGAMDQTGNSANIALSGDGFLMVNYQDSLYYTRAGDFALVDKDVTGVMLPNPNYPVEGGETISFTGKAFALQRSNGAYLVGGNSVDTATNKVTADGKEITADNVVLMMVAEQSKNANGELLYYKTNEDGTLSTDKVVEASQTYANSAAPAPATGHSYYQLTNGTIGDYADGSEPSGSVKLDPANVYVDKKNVLTLSKNTVYSNREVLEYPTAKSSAPSAYQIASNGQITVKPDGKAVVVNGQLAVQRFNNPDSLARLDGGLHQITASTSYSGNNPSVPGQNGSGTTLQGFLESSNVDLVVEFTDMIVTQRAFQANSKTITTADSMLETVMNMTR